MRKFPSNVIQARVSEEKSTAFVSLSRSFDGAIPSLSDLIAIMERQMGNQMQSKFTMHFCIGRLAANVKSVCEREHFTANADAVYRRRNQNQSPSWSQYRMTLLTSRTFNLFVLLQSGVIAFDTSSSIASNKVLDDNVVPRGRSGAGRKLAYPNRHYVYLNYKEAYGIRYDPGENRDRDRVSLPQLQPPDDPNVGESETTPTPEVPKEPEAPEVPETSVSPDEPEVPESPEVPVTNGPMSTEANVPETSTERTTQTTPTMATSNASLVPVTQKRPSVAFSSLTHKTSNKHQNNKHQVVRPISSIRDTLNLIRRRIKQWFTSGIDLNAPLVNGQRFLSVFNIIKFENSECTSTQEMLDQMTGTCYHDYQCAEMGGTSIGECADGLGVCCICALKISIYFLMRETIDRISISI